MNLGLFKKIIFSCFLLINFLQPSKSADFHTSNKNKINKDNQLIWSKILNDKNSSNSLQNNNLEKISEEKKYLNENPDLFLASLGDNQDELVIQSDKQSEINNVLYAEGNVSVNYKGKLLKADNLIYDKLKRKISAEGNITLLFGEQIFKMSNLEYNFNNERGYLLDVKGFINSDNLITDISKNFYDSDIQKLSYFC